MAKKKAVTRKSRKEAAPEQSSLAGMEDNRIPELDLAIEELAKAKSRRDKGREDYNGGLSTIADLMTEKSLKSYTHAGRKFAFEPGKATIKITKVKKKADAK